MRIRRGSPPSIGGTRRVMPRPYTRCRSSGANASKTSWRSSSVSLSRVSSSWLRTKFAHWLSTGGLGSCLESTDQGRRVGASQREVQRLHPDEVELQGELFARVSAEELQLLIERQVHLAEQDGLAAASLQEAADLAQVLVRIADLDTGRSLDEERHRIDAEAVDAELEPEADHLGDLVPHLRVGDVQIGLVAVEAVQEVLSGRLVELPHARLLAREHGLRLLLRRLVDPHVEVAELRRPTAPGVDEPRVLVGRVIDDEVDDDPDAAIVRRADDLDEVAVASESRIDTVEVGDVVAVVTVGTRVERHQPQARHPEVGKVVDALRESGEVADPVAVAVEERLDVEAVDRPPSSTTGRWCR